VNLAAKLEKHNKAENAAACAQASLIELARQQSSRAYSSAFEVRQACAVGGVGEPLDIAVWPA